MPRRSRWPSIVALGGRPHRAACQGPRVWRIPACAEEHLVRRAIAGTPFEGLAGDLTGPLIYGISADPSLQPRC